MQIKSYLIFTLVTIVSIFIHVQLDYWGGVDFLRPQLRTLGFSPAKPLHYSGPAHCIKGLKNSKALLHKRTYMPRTYNDEEQ